MPRPSVVLPLGLVLLAGAGGCRGGAATEIAGGPIVREQRLASSPGVLRKLAVIPFYPAETLGQSPPSRPSTPPPSRWEAAALVTNFVAEALGARGLRVVGPSDVELAFTGEGHAVPRLDPVAAAQLSARSFAATGVLLGRVMRYREREGGAAGATRPASVAFEVSLHEVPSGRRLWTGRFDETQQSLTANVFRARNYPGGGARWLTAAEFARWGAGQVVDAMRAGQAPL